MQSGRSSSACSCVVAQKTIIKKVFSFFLIKAIIGLTANVKQCSAISDQGFFRKEGIKSLKAVGAEKAVVRSYNALAVNPDVLDCDYYRFKELDAGAVNAYQNEYMSQYYWADFLYDEDFY